MADLLLVIDMQNGFVNEKCQHIIPNVIRLIEAFEKLGKQIAFTRFVNRTGSAYERFINWLRLKEAPEINIISALQRHAALVFDKAYYTPFTPAFEQFLKNNRIARIFICGIATESCVLKAAMDSFEQGYEPIVVRDAVYSHAGAEAHHAGLLVISRNIGKGQLKETGELINSLSSFTD